jgi:hypothetical protein
LAALTEWLQLMLGEIARKREELERAHEEQRAREGQDAEPAAAGGSERGKLTGP